jgi:gliding-associated putative ABC transporter substrate-binding component GldG
MMNRASNISLLILVVAIVIAINVLGSFVYGKLDLTDDKRFTLSNATKELVKKVDQPVLVRVLLDGEFPAGFKRLRSATRELLNEFGSISSNIEFEFENPSVGTNAQINQRRTELAKEGIVPTNLRYGDGSEVTSTYIYPYATINYGSRKHIVRLLEDQISGVDEELTLNNSISLLEYKFADGFQKLMIDEKPIILFTDGRGELSKSQTASLEKALRENYNTGRIQLDSIFQISEDADLVIVAGPTESFDLRSQFILDQYLMNGGKVIWMIDYLNANLDSINQYGFFVPETYPIGLEDLFFKYGVRIQPNLVLDLECTRIPQVIGMAGEKAQTQLFPWYYHPLVAPKSNHPIVKNLDRINFFFPSSLDTIRTSTKIEKTILLSSSDYSRFQISPMRLNFEILRYAPDPAKYDKGPQNLAILLEGPFESAFKNRVPQSMLETLDQIDASFKEISPNTKQIFVSDSDFAKNLFNTENQRISPIGFNKWEQRTFGGNEAFILNAVDYMLDDFGVLSSRSKEVKLRLLNTVKAKSEKMKWRFINLILPMLFLLLFALGYSYWRKKRYSS